MVASGGLWRWGKYKVAPWWWWQWSSWLLAVIVVVRFFFYIMLFVCLAPKGTPYAIHGLTFVLAACNDLKQNITIPWNPSIPPIPSAMIVKIMKMAIHSTTDKQNIVKMNLELDFCTHCIAVEKIAFWVAEGGFSQGGVGLLGINFLWSEVSFTRYQIWSWSMVILTWGDRVQVRGDVSETPGNSAENLLPIRWCS